MKIALLGYGKMAQLIEQIATQQGHQIVARFSLQLGTLLSRSHELEAADIAIDFSQASAVLNHLEICCSLGKPLVIGTTGWNDALPLAKQIIEKAQIGCLFAPNFAIGVYLFQKIVTHAASLFQSFPEYDVAGVEYHHKQKLDHPSGTAKHLIEAIHASMPRIEHIDFSSVRCGQIPGTHTIHFDSAADTITLTHQARNRTGFALGALACAEWLLPRQGFFSLEDMLQQTPFSTSFSEDHVNL